MMDDLRTVRLHPRFDSPSRLFLLPPLPARRLFFCPPPAASIALCRQVAAAIKEQVEEISTKKDAKKL